MSILLFTPGRSSCLFVPLCSHNVKLVTYCEFRWKVHIVHLGHRSIIKSEIFDGYTDICILLLLHIWQWVISLINIRIFHGRTRKPLGYYVVTSVHVKTCAILLSLFIKFSHLKCHFQPIFKLRAKALCQYFAFLHYLINIHHQTTVIHRRLQSLW